MGLTYILIQVSDMVAVIIVRAIISRRTVVIIGGMDFIIALSLFVLTLFLRSILFDIEI